MRKLGSRQYAHAVRIAHDLDPLSDVEHRALDNGLRDGDGMAVREHDGDQHARHGVLRAGQYAAQKPEAPPR